ncbi:hypothetical protein H5410_015251 [Solanum commersonii]|uniref:DUF7588 domain-containing protein n=1 Tax=Solanum commersonii TaxID=4109 RepID=A0A9J5ZTK3_SOLCO|nr:hypothetical protein H5410_015251 [Solanum commersonii]
MREHQIYFSPASLARKYIQNEFLNEKWNRFKTWFFDTYSREDLNNISQEFYETCALHNHIMFFVPWFITTYLPLFINVLERSYKDESGNIIQSIYPPQAPFILPNNTGITFTAFHKFIDNEVAAYVKVIGEHICSLDKKLDNLTNLIIQIDDKLKLAKQVSEQASTSKQPDNNGNTYARKPSMQTYYYPRPTPQDVLIEERDWNQTNTSYSGSEIYE